MRKTMKGLSMLVAWLVIASFRITSADNHFKHSVIAPQIIREGVWEKVVLNIYGVDGTVDVVASLDLDGITRYDIENGDARRPILMRIKYDKPPLGVERNRRDYVQLTITVSQKKRSIFIQKLRMRLVENSGYIQVQTDRPIYRPEEVVKIRVIPLNQEQGPERHREVELVIRIPSDKVGVERKLLRMIDPNKFIQTTFHLPEYPEYGVWSIEARFTDQKVVKWSTRNFEVRPYVLPTFNVRIEMKQPFVAVKNDMSKEYIEGKLTAHYSYGKPVSGTFFFVAKLKRPNFENPVQFYQFPAKLDRVATIVSGEAKFRINASKVFDVFPDVNFQTLEEEGASIIIAASVTGQADGVIESDISKPIPFVRSPYQLDISRMSKYYTPGTAFEMKVDVLDKVTEDPVEGITVVITGPTTCGPIRCPQGQCCTKGKCKECKAPNSIIMEKTNENGQVNVKFNMGANAVVREYTIQTKDSQVTDENEAQMTITLQPYMSKSRSVLMLSATRKIAQVGEKNFEIAVWYKKAPTEIRYLILARGSIFSAEVHEPQIGGIQTVLRIPIEGEMVPSFKIFAYYLTNDTNELISNSLWVDVKDACKKELEVDVPEQVLPGQQVTVEFTGSPEALVGVSAVDRAAYFLYGNSRLTRKGVFEELNQYDEGCVREGGKNSRHVFEEGGLQIEGGTLRPRNSFPDQCEESPSNRVKRSSGNNAELEAKFEEEAENLRCMFDGQMDSLAEEDCAARAKRVEQQVSYECAEIFFKSCRERYRQTLIGGDRRLNNAAGFKALASTRSNFEESMFWRTEMLNPAGKLKLTENAKDSITTFEFDAVSMHATDGFCAAPTKNMRIFKNVFIQLKVPYALKRREQTEIRATVFNYGARLERITVMVKMGKDICSRFPEGVFSEVMTVSIEPEAAETTSFSILPLRIPKSEKVEIEVQALNEGNHLLDHIRKWILVEPEGQIKEIKGTRAIDLKNKPPGQADFFEIEFQFPEKYTPETRRCWLYPFSNFMGPIIEFDPVTKQPKNDIRKIIRMPSGCGEQTMLSMGPNVYAHRYLRKVNKMAPGSEEEQGSLDKMKSGFTNQLKYRCNCEPKVWSVFPGHAPSVWLNAYVNKVFAQAKQFYVAMDVFPICQSIGWLLTMQNQDGSVQSGGKVIHQEMHGAVGSTFSLTAYVMISLVESQSICPEHSKAVGTAIGRMSKYFKLNENDKQLEQPYALALVCYAFSIWQPKDRFAARMRRSLMKKMQESNDSRLAFWKGAPLKDVQGTGTHAYWYRRKPLAIDIEATSYALMAIMHAEAAKPRMSQQILDTIKKIVLWLIEQRDENGGFTTTQDTVIGLQALSEYMTWSTSAVPSNKEVSIDMVISAPNGTDLFNEPMRLHLDKSNENVTKPIELSSSVISKGKVSVLATGEGEATLSHRCVYRTLTEEDSCHYDLAVSTAVEDLRSINARFGQAKPIRLKISIQVSKPRGLKSGQSVIEVNLISGYEPVENSLQQLSRTYYVDGIVERFDIANRKVYLYLKEVTEDPIRLAFLVNRAFPVNKPEPATVTVYDYYEPSVRCSQFYGLPGDIPNLRTTPCKGENGSEADAMCKCAEGGCPKCRTRREQLGKTACLSLSEGKCELCKEPDQQNCFNLTKAACEATYAYKVNIEQGVDDATGVFVEFAAAVSTVYKRGQDSDIKPGDVRKFISRSDCYQGCADPEVLSKPDREGNVNPHIIAKNMTVLIIGTNFEENIDKNGFKQRQYNLGDTATVERLYSQEKCKKAKEDLESKACKKKSKKQTKRQKAKCRKAKAISQSCSNMLYMRRMLIRGCD